MKIKAFYKDIMAELEEAGWKKAEEKKKEEITEADMRAIFNLVDIDKSGSVSKRVKQFMIIIKNVLLFRKLVWHANFSKNGLGFRM